MKQSERGFTLIETLVGIAILALIAGAATMATFQVINVTKSSNDHITAVRQVQNAGYWISRDALMAENVIVDDLTPPDFLILNWTEWGYDEDSTYHSVRYSFQDLSDGIGKLRRTYWSSAGINEEILVAEYIYYNPGDSDNTTKASYPSSVLTVQIAASFEEANETREYRVWHRPNF